MSDYLTDEDRTVLGLAIRPPTKWADHGARVVERLLDADDAAYAMETLLPAVERIVARHRAEAWNEGYDMGDPYQRRGQPGKGKAANPYRAAIEGDAR